MGIKIHKGVAITHLSWEESNRPFSQWERSFAIRVEEAFAEQVSDITSGMMLDWGVHLIDQIMHMISEKVISIHCNMCSMAYPEVDDSFRLTMIFDSGLTAIVEVATNNYITLPRWYVLGKTGTLQIDGWDGDGKIVHNMDNVGA
ncbi:MAG: hypothetical protein FWD05_13310 [Oscillospiraceae bacterium]|nr:hypothetical protein [Oscillospiraceae bacterium]